MRAAILLAVGALLLTACSGSGGGATPPVAGAPPPGNTGVPPVVSMPGSVPSPTPSPFNAAQVKLTEYPQPALPLYVAAGPDGSAYFGNGSNGTGTNLYRFLNGALSQTQPAPPPSGYDPGGGVYGITVTPTGSVYWLSAYFGPSFAPYVVVECGGSGTGALCEPAGVDEPTSMLVDGAGRFWLAGLSFDGGGQISINGVTSAFPEGVMQIVNGPGGLVWGVLQNTAQGTAQYSIGEFQAAGDSIQMLQNYPLPAGASIGSMTAGADGALWLTDNGRNAIERIDSSGKLTSYPLSQPNALAAPWYGQSQIATACDGSMWFAEPGVNKIGRIDTHGTIAEFPLAHAGALPGPVAATPAVQGKCVSPEIWVGEQNANALLAVTFR